MYQNKRTFRNQLFFFKVQYQYALMSINLSAKNLSHHPQSSASFSDSWYEKRI